jgi:diacylglycerol kinase family enzyme
VLVLFVSNNAYPLSSLGGRPRLDAGMLEVSALRRTEGQELGRALENLVGAHYQAGEGWARWTTTSFEVDSPGGTLEVGIDGEPVVLDTPIEFRIHAGALRVLLPPSRPVSGRPSKPTPPARRSRTLDQAQAARLVRLWRLLGRVGEREFGPKRS